MSLQIRRLREITSLRSWIIALVVGIAGSGLIIWSALDVWEGKAILQRLVNTLGLLLLVPVAIGILWELFLRRAFVDELLGHFSIAESVRAAGIISYAEYFFYGEEWASYFNDSNKVDIFFSYASTWRNVNEDNLHTFVRRGGRVRVVLPDPEDNNVVTELARRFSYTKTELRDKIKDAIRYFEALKAVVETAKVDIWLMPKAPLYTFYRFDNQVIVTLFKHRPGRINVPTIIAQRGGKLFDFVSAEFDAMIEENGLRSIRVA